MVTHNIITIIKHKQWQVQFARIVIGEFDTLELAREHAISFPQWNKVIVYENWELIEEFDK